MYVIGHLFCIALTLLENLYRPLVHVHGAIQVPLLVPCTAQVADGVKVQRFDLEGLFVGGNRKIEPAVAMIQHPHVEVCLAVLRVNLHCLAVRLDLQAFDKDFQMERAPVRAAAQRIRSNEGALKGSDESAGVWNRGIQYSIM